MFRDRLHANRGHNLTWARETTMGELTLNSATRNTDAVDPEAIEYLKQEIEHYYKAELQHEQRANWFMVTAIALSGFTGNKLVDEWARLGCYAQSFFIIGMLLLAVCVTVAVIAMWPLVGWKGRLAWRPSRQASSERVLPGNAAADLVKHFDAHRRRAMVRAGQVIWVLIFFVLGLISLGLGSAAILW